MGGDDKTGLSVAFFGPKGSGKTTALGELCQKLGGFSEAQADIKEIAREFGSKTNEHAWILDTLPEEREDGKTITSSTAFFETAGFRYAGIDTPGSAQRSWNNSLRVLSMTDIAALVVSAADREFEAATESGFIKETALACFTMGVKSVIILVTKMDSGSVSYSKSRFDEISKAVNGILKDVGYKQKEPVVVPLSSTLGDNLVTKSDHTSWYAGPCLSDALDSLAPSVNRPAEKPLRLPVLKVHDVKGLKGAVIMGRVEAGKIRAGISVIFSPSGRYGKVLSVQINGKDVDEASAGDVVGVAIDGIKSADLHRGMVMSESSKDPAAAAETLVAQVIVLDHPGLIKDGYCPAIAIHTAQVPCEFEELLTKIDRKTGKEMERVKGEPITAKSGEVVTARLRPRAPVCVETFAAYPSIGRFAVRDHNRTIAVGVVKEVTKRPIPEVVSDDEAPSP